MDVNIFYIWIITSKEEAQMCWRSVRTSHPIILWNWPNQFKVWSDNVWWTTVISSRDRSFISVNHHLGSGEFQKITFTSMSFKLNSRTWSHDTGQQILCFDRCQLTIYNMDDQHQRCSQPISCWVTFFLSCLCAISYC